MSITDYQANPYDAIVSGLPLNAFDAEFVSVVLAKYEALIKPTGKISYFEYIGLGNIKKSFLVGKSRKNLEEVLSAKQQFTKKHHAVSTSVFRNFPPARVQTCTIKKDLN